MIWIVPLVVLWLALLLWWHALARAESRLRRHRITTSVVMVDPNVAARWLERNTHNRHLRPHIVAKYRRGAGR